MLLLIQVTRTDLPESTPVSVRFDAIEAFEDLTAADRIDEAQCFLYMASGVAFPIRETREQVLQAAQALANRAKNPPILVPPAPGGRAA